MSFDIYLFAIPYDELLLVSNYIFHEKSLYGITHTERYNI